MGPDTRYARSGELFIAYQVIGDGPVDLLYVPSWISQVEHYWEHPMVARYFEHLAGFSRLIMFDRRGSGLSDPVPTAPALEEQIDDVVAVLDAAGSERPGVFAQLEGGAMAALFAATHPERVRSLMLYEAMPRMSWAPDYDWALRREDREASVAGDRMEGWGRGAALDVLSPRSGQDPRLREWFAKLERLAASPGTAAKLIMMNGEVDVRAVLPSIQAPTLVLHRADDQYIDLRHSRHLADNIPGAKLVLLPGDEAISFGPETQPLIEEVEEFLTGTRHHNDPERILATVMFSDIVDSTRHAVELGDSRWRAILESLERPIGELLMRHRGRAVKTMGDGFLATFDGPARGIRCAEAIRELAREQFGVEVRSGLHTGEIELIGDDIGGLAVHIGARVGALAGPGEVLVSGTVKDLVAGSGIAFTDRGEHELKGVPDQWRLWAADAAGPRRRATGATVSRLAA
ncbi:MAG TPA: adenylate/guanylate cyclase domain-containing protein [Solirubrobacteraceae bacterium]|nr:adenylate/guanylate cyclase domain-containing protein [Solirubrobacteraceae bacterium]